VWITNAIGVGMVATMIGHPADHRSLKGQGAGKSQSDFDIPLGVEAPMGKQSVKSRSHTVPGARVQGDEENDVESGWEAPRQRYCGGDDAGERSKEDEQGDRELRSARR
jgi:hypothetical protein